MSTLIRRWVSFILNWNLFYHHFLNNELAMIFQVFFPNISPPVSHWLSTFCNPLISHYSWLFSLLRKLLKHYSKTTSNNLIGIFVVITLPTRRSKCHEVNMCHRPNTWPGIIAWLIRRPRKFETGENLFGSNIIK